MTFEYVLALDIAGNPSAWISAQEAVLLYAKDRIAWDLGTSERVFRGGTSRLGLQSAISIKPIVSVCGSDVMASFSHQAIPLGSRDNRSLFHRDRHTCAYCAQVFASKDLTRDHIVPRSRGGTDDWMNCVSCCRACNQSKADKWVHDFKPLVYLPYIPNRAEAFILAGRRILADQHEYLAAQLPKHSRLRD